jgi:alpha-L-arabinofuranosidase
VHYCQSVVLNVKTRQLFVKLVNASADAKKANIDLSRFKGMKETAVKTVLSGNPQDENNFDQQPVSPKKETIKAEKKFSIDLQPYSMVMITYEL